MLKQLAIVLGATLAVGAGYAASRPADPPAPVVVAEPTPEPAAVQPSPEAMPSPGQQDQAAPAQGG